MEAALVMPLVLLIVFVILALCFYIHGTVWYTAAAYEASLLGSETALREDDEAARGAAEYRAQQRLQRGIPGVWEPAVEVRQQEQMTTVTYRAETLSVLGGYRWNIKADGTVKVVDPVTFIRKFRAVKEVVHAEKNTTLGE